MLWLAKGYALPASMYASQIWGTRYMKQGAASISEMDCPLQTVHFCLLKGILGVKPTTPNWSVLREYGQEPLKSYWFRAAVRFYNALLCNNSNTLAKVLKADIAMSTINKKCWSAEFLDAFHGLELPFERSGDFQHRVRTFQTIPQSQFVFDVRKRLRSIWYQGNQLGNVDQMDKAAKYHNWVALSLRSVTVDGSPFSVPRYLHLDLGKQRQRNVARFRLHSHALRVETRSREHHDGTCDKCGLQAQFKMKNTLCSCALACKCVRWGFNLQTCFTIYQCHTKLLSIRLELFISPKFLFWRRLQFFSRNKLMIPIILFQSLWMFFDGWCSPATWTVKLPGWRSNLNL